ncbi:MAG: ABC transporter ATP-binding protein [Oscillospiraceae bacterium]|nr:ABC transporter ATP-binding protein [Oscillospiraceae bacterium]MBR3534900.1 ABC transporter ATP-binding protein [Oscillospiraceae bacterium]MBR6836823.1 ABC transporter ATP-binding protein [Oscillospiraceae bacterium]
MSVINTDKLTKRYGKYRGITELDLRVEEGEFFGFIGPNGAGKSTTIRTLLGLIKPTSGSAQIFGKDIVTGHREILADIGYMPSEANFYSSMTADEIIKLSARLRKKDCTAEASRLCDRLGVDRKKKVEELSLGNRKKISVVCALQHKPRLCILDEPTSGLDPLMQKEFFDILKERNAEGSTIMLSSHILSEIQKNCTRAAIIKEGRLIALDSVENLSKTAAKRVTLHGVSAIPEGLETADANVTGNSVSFLYNGDIQKLLSVLGTLPVTDMTMTEPDLDEIFMHYYQKGGE